MTKASMLALCAGLTLGAAMPGDADAQLTGRERSEAAKRGGVIVPQTDRRDDRRDDRCYDGRYDDHRDKNDRKRDRDRDRDRWDNCDYDRRDRDDRYDDDRYRRGSGPKFCQNGQGHPVHGRSWCRQKGWENARMRNTGWGDVILRRPRYSQSDLGRSVLMDILGRTVYGRFDGQRSRLGLGSGLTGQWRDTSAGSILNLYAGGIQVGQLLDRNRDGRADVVLMNYGR